MKIKGYLWPDEKFMKPHVRKPCKYSWGLEPIPPGLNPASIVKGSKKSFYRYMNSKRKTKEIMGTAAE